MALQESDDDEDWQAFDETAMFLANVLHEQPDEYDTTEVSALMMDGDMLLLDDTAGPQPHASRISPRDRDFCADPPLVGRLELSVAGQASPDESANARSVPASVPSPIRNLSPTLPNPSPALPLSPSTTQNQSPTIKDLSPTLSHPSPALPLRPPQTQNRGLTDDIRQQPNCEFSHRIRSAVTPALTESTSMILLLRLQLWSIDMEIYRDHCLSFAHDTNAEI